MSLKEPSVVNLVYFRVRKKKNYIAFGDDWGNLDWISENSVFFGVGIQWLCRTRALFLRGTCSVFRVI